MSDQLLEFQYKMSAGLFTRIAIVMFAIAGGLIYLAQYSHKGW